MSRPAPAHRRQNSIFAKLLATMLAMAMAVLLIISGFFFFIISPTVGQSIDRVTVEYVKLLMEERPDVARLKNVAERLNLDVRYDGHSGNWSTTALPAVAEVARMNQNPLFRYSTLGQQYHVVTQPDGGTYLIAWRFHSQIQRAHDQLVLLLLCAVLMVVFVAHWILRRALRPIEWLHHGFATLSRGDLNTTVQKRTNDELGALTDAFNRLVEHVREMVKSRDQLLLDVSHELRSPLTRMKVALALSEENEQKTRLLTNVAEMEAMVTELLEIERLKGDRGLTIESCNLIELVHGVVERFSERAPGVQFDPASARIELDADPEMVRVVLNNLLENALKYSGPDSQAVRISLIESDQAVLIRVVDNGPGIPEDDLPRLFEPFFRVDRSRSRKTGGYGLGLSLCQRIMQAHGGSITAENRPEGGASFTVRFPKNTSRPQ